MKRKSLKYKNKKSNRNSLLSENLIYTGTSDLSSQLQLIQFNEDFVEFVSLKNFDDFKNKRKHDCVCWLNVKGLSDIKLIEEIGNYFSLHVLEMQSILNIRHIPKVEEYDNNILLILKAFSINEEQELNKEHLCFVLGDSFLLTFQETDNLYFEDIRKAFEDNSIKKHNRSSDYLFSLLVKNISNNYLDFIEQIEDALEETESDLMEFDKVQTDIGWRIQSLRKEYLLLKKTVLPIKESFSRLLRSENVLLHAESMAYFNDSYDHLLMAVQKIEICRETLSSLVDLYVSNNDLRMNDIMKRLTVVGSIFIPLTFVVGVWGMNFSNMPELNMKYGYLYAWIVMIVIGLFFWLYIRFRKWY